jgi:hypothetical protein
MEKRDGLWQRAELPFGVAGWIVSSPTAAWLAFVAAATLWPASAVAQPGDLRAACEAYSQSEAVFVGVAGRPTTTVVQPKDDLPFALRVTPMTVERSFLGTPGPTIYVTPLGVEAFPAPGRKYLVYGRGDSAPDIVMASPGHGMKSYESAAADPAFLDAVTPGAGAARSTGSSSSRRSGRTGPPAPSVAANVVVRMTRRRNQDEQGGNTSRDPAREYVHETVTEADGRFMASGVPEGIN